MTWACPEDGDWFILCGHYETSPREREDEQERDEREFGTTELAAEDEDDRIRRMGEGGPFDEE